jgi:hypothetical protein
MVSYSVMLITCIEMFALKWSNFFAAYIIAKGGL